MIPAKAARCARTRGVEVVDEYPAFDAPPGKDGGVERSMNRSFGLFVWVVRFRVRSMRSFDTFVEFVQSNCSLDSFSRFVRSTRSHDSFIRLVHSIVRSIRASLTLFLLVMEVFEDGFLVDLARGFFRFLEILKEVLPYFGRILARKKILGRDFSHLRSRTRGAFCLSTMRPRSAAA